MYLYIDRYILDTCRYSSYYSNDRFSLLLWTESRPAYADSQMGGSSLQYVEIYLLTGEYLQIQSCTHRVIHKELVTPS